MSVSQFTDQELIQLFISGNESALSVLIKKHETRLFTYIKMMVKDQTLAEDIYQDTFMKVIYKLKSGHYNEEGKFLPWLTRIAHNLVIDHFRKQKRMPMVNSTEENDVFRTIKLQDNNIEDIIIKEQILKDVKKLIKLLPEEQQEVLILRHYANLSFQEIAEMTGVSINTALGRMRYALINIRKIVKSKEIILA
jgi:RNA polymerase sigma-70 factor (ECF subfamily)